LTHQSGDQREIARTFGHRIGDQWAEPYVVAADREQENVDRPLAVFGGTIVW
jgi:hypothetical protein